ncbi:hypothetical protein TD95_004875 [Thielaviopsis punctulata]|uniref:Uncharacterized protein n=1 Tax=Thielaviopsis punctulata TaxID=72032 RepID=A0A0F4ZBZ6_9PEZI|nr:hypothetical protein TD95_004875 [Thielaviopsis punctulata]
MTRKETTVPPVAVVGLGLRLPGGVSTTDDLWSLLINKRDARSPVPASRWNAEGWSNNTASGYGYFLDEEVSLKKFDSSMFSMNRTELEALDPRQKLLLEVVWECMENAGQKDWRGSRTGVFVGNFGQDWMEITARDPLMKGAFRVYNGADFYLSNRISYEYNLSGPSMAIQTACSSGLTVIHEACQSLYNGDCKGAIVAGTSLLLSPLVVEVMTEQGVLSPDGSCRTFSADANGYARGEGINAVYLKLLDDAIRDGDPIRAVIRGTALSANGKTAGMSLPDAKHQQEAIQQAYKVAGISDLTQTPFVECHGTGTPTGDPIEVNGVIKAFGTSGENGKPTYIGSIKPNLGHAEGASGISSLIKAVLAVENGVIPPNIKFNTPNPKSKSTINQARERILTILVPFDTARVIVPVEPTPFPADRATRVSINSFGIGGSNAHLIVDSASEFLQNHKALPIPALSFKPRGLTSEWPRLVVLTSSSMSSLNSRVRDMKDYIEAHPRTILNDLSNTLATRRVHLPQRSFSVVTQTQNEPFEFEKPQLVRAGPPQPVFVFTGQGAQWGGMGSDLLKIFPEFAEDVRAMDAALTKLGPAAPKWTVEKMIAVQDAETKALFGRPEFSQPLCTAVQIGALRFLEKSGIKPTAVVGHSSGEIAAAYAAGGLTLEEAIVAAYLRGWAVQAEQAKETRLKGGMAAIGLGKVDVEKYVRPGVVIACENSPQSVTLAGDEDALEATLVDIAKTSAFNRRLRVDVAYHSHHMKAVGSKYEAALSPQLTKASQKLDVPFYSSVTLKKIEDSGAFNSAYWRSNLESPVRFDTAVQSIIGDRPDNDLVFIEVGPHSALQGPLRQISQAAVQKGRPTSKALSYIPTLVRNVPARISLTKTAGHAFSHGIPVNFDFLTPASSPTAKPLTDLPRYPWDHSSEFWNESRLSAAHRFPKYPRHELLGTRGLESTDLEPMWRNIIAPNDIPWAQDHIVGNDAVLPCTGYVSIMGEALRQLSGGNDAGYTLRDVAVKSALVLPTTREVEITTTARLVRASAAGSPDAWYDFSISMYNGSSWVQLCVGKGRAGAESGYISKAKMDSAEKYTREISPAPWYERLTHVGLTYGPRFQALSAISAVPNELACSATLDVYFDKEHGKKPPAIYAQHPVTLDAVLQMSFVAATSGLAKRLESASLPTAVDFIYVKPSGSVKSFYAQGSVTENASKGKSLGWHSGKVIDPETKEVVIDIKRCHFTYFKSQTKSHGLGSGFDHVGAARLVWRPDIELSKPAIAMKPLPDVHRSSKTLLEKIVALCVLRSIDVLAVENAKSSSEAITFAEPYLEKYTSWLSTEKANMLSGNGSWSTLCPEAKVYAAMTAEERENEYAVVEAAIAALGSRHNDVAVITRLCRKLADQMYALSVGDTNSVEILFNRNSETLVSLYDFLGDLLDFSEFFKLCGHANPGLRILEIGAGTGASASRVLRALAADPKKPRYAEYTFTDVSSGFFESARERLKDYSNIHYKVLDISRDPAEQGFQLGSYDLIVASNVIHATPLLKQTLTNTRALLRDGGRFYLQEIVGSTNLFKFLVGAFSGWWLGEADDRAEAPTIPVERWHRELTAVGFSGAGDAVLDDDESQAYMANIVTRALPAEKAEIAKTATVVYQKEKPAFATSVSSVLVAQGFSVSWEKLSDFAASASSPSVVLSVLDLERPFFSDMTDKDYALLMQLVSNLSSPLVWLTHAIQINVEDPRYGQIIGLARNVRNELSKTFATVELGAFDVSAADAVAIIVQCLVGQDIGVTSVHHDADAEFAVHSGVIYTPRYETLAVADEIAEEQTGRTLVTLVSGETGSCTKTKWVKASVAARLEAHDVEIDVQSTSLNYKYHDTVVSSNSLEGSETRLGVEAAGIVTRIGALVDNVKVGDRVMFLAPGAISSVKTVKKDLVMKIPEDLDFAEAASMPISYMTAFRALVSLANLEPEQTVLIHSASGSLGQAAIQVAQMLGAKIFATAGTEEKADFIVRQFGIPPSRVFSSRNTSFLHDLQAATGGEGVDVVLNSLSGELLHASWECVAAYGKMINVTREHEQLPANVLTSNRTFIGLDVSMLVHDRPAEVKRLLKKTLDHFIHGHIKPVTVAEVVPAKDVMDGFIHLHTNQHIGRVLLSFESLEALHAVATTKQQAVSFSSFKTYLLAGGMGGLGKSIATWMVEHGARSFVFLSRSAGTSAADKAFIKELESQGCRVRAIAGSVVDAETVKKAVQSAPSRLGGIMQLSMVLRDAALRDMTYDQWMAAQGPKVQGTWNLHNATANNALDFFVLFSSISALSGYPGQANYTAASTFVEAFAQYRQRQGLACSVVNIGAVQGVGYISRSKAISATFASIGQSMLQEQDVLDAMQISIRRSFSLPSGNFTSAAGNDKNGSYSFAGQLITGLRSTRLTSETNSRVPWKRDVRTSIVQADEALMITRSYASDSSNASVATPDSSVDPMETPEAKLRELVRLVTADPQLLKAQSTLDSMVRNIGRVLCRILLQPEEGLESGVTLAQMGLDSMVSIEIRNWWKRTFLGEISVLQIMNAVTIERLGELAVETLQKHLA